MKKYLEILHSKKVFRLEDIVNLTNNINTAKGLLSSYKKQALVIQIRRNLYSATDLATKTTLANKFEIGSQISFSSYISYHSALEYHGIAHQIFYNLFISTDSRFNDFDFEDMHYTYCKSNNSKGVEMPLMNSLVRVTTLERTVVDCIDQIGRAGGLEELIHCISMITYLDESKLQDYLEVYNKSFLYKKVGFILQIFQNELKLTTNFISLCHQKGALHVKSLTDAEESDTFYKEWNIYAPKNILSYLEQGSNELV